MGRIDGPAKAGRGATRRHDVATQCARCLIFRHLATSPDTPAGWRARAWPPRRDGWREKGGGGAPVRAPAYKRLRRGGGVARTPLSPAMPSSAPATEDDLFDAVLRPPPNESEADRARRLAAEAEAARVSKAIDETLRLERARDKKKRIVRVLLLGQSESGAHIFMSCPAR
jgi:hypothetical protein